jgi:hypothetical protein
MYIRTEWTAFLGKISELNVVLDAYTVGATRGTHKAAHVAVEFALIECLPGQVRFVDDIGVVANNWCILGRVGEDRKTCDEKRCETHADCIL